MNRILRYIFFGFLFLVPLLAFAQVDINLETPILGTDSKSLEQHIFLGEIAALAPFLASAIFIFILGRFVMSNSIKATLFFLIGLSFAAPYLISTQNIGMCIDYYTEWEAFRCGVRFMFNQRNPLVYVTLVIGIASFIKGIILLLRKHR